MTRVLSTPPVIAPGFLPDSPQPVLPAAAGLLLRPWEPSDAPAFLSAYQDHEIAAGTRVGPPPKARSGSTSTYTARTGNATDVGGASVMDQAVDWGGSDVAGCRKGLRQGEADVDQR